MRWGQVERRCGKVRGRSDESAPVSGSPGVYTAGQGHDRCYHMRVLDPISTLVAAADGDGVWEAGSRGSWGKGGVRAEEMNLCQSYCSMGIKLSPDLSAKAMWYDTKAID